mgnify:CR=1 FL=1
MQYAIELFFDKETEASLFELAKKVADANLSTKYLEWKTRPHVTLACFNDVDEDKIEAKPMLLKLKPGVKPALRAMEEEA